MVVDNGIVFRIGPTLSGLQYSYNLSQIVKLIELHAGNLSLLFR